MTAENWDRLNKEIRYTPNASLIAMVGDDTLAAHEMRTILYRTLRGSTVHGEILDTTTVSDIWNAAVEEAGGIAELIKDTRSRDGWSVSLYGTSEGSEISIQPSNGREEDGIRIHGTNEELFKLYRWAQRTLNAREM